jgi:hypothetical protein
VLNNPTITSVIINKINIILTLIMAIGEGSHTSKWIKSNGEEETKIL